MSGTPSILIKNIYYMLAYAYKALRQEGFEKIGAEDFENIHDLFAAILARGMEQQVKQGLNREYVKSTKLQKVLRGKIDIAGTVMQCARQRRELSCVYEVLTEDNLLNRILKAAALLLLHNGDVKAENKKALQKVLRYFGSVQAISPAAINWSVITYRTGNASYRMLIYLCRLLFDGMLISEGGRVKLAKFLGGRELCDLYEKFVLAYYQRHYPQLNPYAPMINWHLDSGGDSFLPRMYTDVTLENDSRILIIDTKCYRRILTEQYDKKSISSGNLYQIYAYAKNKQAVTNKAVSGMLLYARTREDVVPDAAYSMGGNKIYVRTLDLNCDFAEISKQLNKIAEENFSA